MLPSKASDAFNDLMTHVEHINEQNGGSACALYVIQNEHVAFEDYSGRHSHDTNSKVTEPTSQFNVASVRKSYIGLAVAYALYQGSIKSLDDPVLNYLTSGSQPTIPNRVTIRHLLTHTHGLRQDEDGRVFYAFEAGTAWEYNNVGIHILTQIISQVTGRSLSEFLYTTVFQPLEMKETAWHTTPNEMLVPAIIDDGTTDSLLDDISDGSRANLFVSARELALWAYIHLKMGRIDGKSVIPEQAIRTSISVQSPLELPTGLPRNGCLWLVKHGRSEQSLIGNNVPDGSYKIVGITGPVVLVVPPLDLVVVRMANRVGNYEDEHGSYIDYLKSFSDLAVMCAKKNWKID
ncbi:serine hydrolase domain-containing protein [Alicyclobacillus fodiniaquatilis]|uniref:Serine hydrolase domain-containing protein n=1 Tax=Alicyclobacillus fodiniaquatilis TaxID=1661150 RepID=A0ABW4JJI3_9BACL